MGDRHISNIEEPGRLTDLEARRIFDAIVGYIKQHDHRPPDLRFTLARAADMLGLASANSLSNYRSAERGPDRKRLPPERIAKIAELARMNPSQFSDRRWLDAGYNPSPAEIFLMDNVRELDDGYTIPAANDGDADPTENRSAHETIGYYTSDPAPSGKGWIMRASPFSKILSPGKLHEISPAYALRVESEMSGRIAPGQTLYIYPKLPPNYGSIIVIKLKDEPDVWFPREFYARDGKSITVYGRDSAGQKELETYSLDDIKEWATALQY